MPNMQYTARPLTDWSTEISAPQASAQAHTTTSTTTTTTSSASAAGHGGAAPMTTTTTTGTASAAQAAQPSCSAPGAQQQPQSYPTPMAQQPQTAPMMQQPQTAPMMQQPQSYPASPDRQPAAAPAPSSGLPAVARNEFHGASGTLDLDTHQPIEVIDAPTSMNEAFLGSLKAMLLRNRGSFVTATFLIGTQGTTTWEGILHDVGTDHIIIFQPGRQRYIACDIYALKYIEFYDTRERDACAQLLRQSGRNSAMDQGTNNFY